MSSCMLLILTLCDAVLTNFITVYYWLFRIFQEGCLCLLVVEQYWCGIPTELWIPSSVTGWWFLTLHCIFSTQKHSTSVEKLWLSHPLSFVYKMLGVTLRQIHILQILLPNFGNLVAFVHGSGEVIQFSDLQSLSQPSLRLKRAHQPLITSKCVRNLSFSGAVWLPGK